MDYKKFIIKYAEIGTKGKNRYVFEEMLCKRMRQRLKPHGEFLVHREYGRIYVDALSEFDFPEVVETLRQIFGICGICPVLVETELTEEKIKAACVSHLQAEYGEEAHSFKARVRRNNKSFPVDSQEMNHRIGAAVLAAMPQLSVDVHHPDIMLDVEIRGEVYIYSRVIPGAGGLPVGSNGKAMALLSGGIDSPVAGYMIAKRGVALEAVYFNAPPYTSERAKQKVIRLAEQVAQYAGVIKLHIVNFTEIQLAIYENCPHDELTIIMKRVMYRVAQDLALADDCQCLVTGESIGQVSSQTTQSLLVIDRAIGLLPVMRPLIGMDKQEIIDLSEQIGTYETSILPYEDCCTIFVAKHPVTRPKIERIEASEQALTGIIEPLYEKALSTVEVVYCH